MDSHVAVTGAEGFIGSHLVEQLVANGHHVQRMAGRLSTGVHWGLLTRRRQPCTRSSVAPWAKWFGAYLLVEGVVVWVVRITVT